MNGSHRRGARHEMNIWPGWVDALSSLIMVIIFVLMIFVVSQFYLAHTLTGRDQALAQLNQRIAELTTLLGVERQTSADLRLNVAQLSDQLQASLASREKLSTDLNTLGLERDQLTTRLAALSQRADTSAAEASRIGRDLEEAYKTIDADRDKITLQLRDIARLEADLKALHAARDKLEADVAALTVLARALEKKSGDLTSQLNAATADQAKRSEELRLTEEQRRKLDALLAEARDQTRQLTEQAAAGEQQRLKLGESLRLNEEQRRQLMAELAVLRVRSKELDSKLASEAEKTMLAQKAAQQEIDQRNARIAELSASLESTQGALGSEQKLTADSRSRIEALSAEVAALRKQMVQLTTTLEAEQKHGTDQQAQIADLTTRLNVALVNKVEELARYRSEFFGRLRDAIGTRPDIRIVGDRFVFQSEVLFPTGSATLQEAGKAQLGQLARALLDIAQTIPPDVNWILRVDGHTDMRRIATAQFPSNWELSTGRAISVVKFLVDQGIPAERLAATGFGEFQPLDANGGDDAFARNRRIELKLDQR